MIKWLDDITKRIVEENKQNVIITCQCGISTTGIAHIGNFRELIITHLVAENLKLNGKNVRLVLSFDDFDRFKKVPKGIDLKYEKYIGMPNYSFPSHIDQSLGYAEYYENIIKSELDYLGIEMEHLYQSKKYLNNDYLEFVKLALNERENIFEIIKKYKTQELTLEDQKNYYPIRIYCSCCNKDSTTILNYDSINETITYQCGCGHYEIKKIDELKIKLKFNVEWPMRWNYEGVSFEPCGKGHAEDLGALNISKEINEKIYKKQNPIIISYAFLNIKGNKGRMSKDSKELIKICDVLKVMPKEMILYYFLMNEPSKEMSLSLTSDVLKLYADFENFISDPKNQDIKKILKIDYQETLSFSDLIKYLPIVNFDISKLKSYINFEENKHNLEKIRCAINWLNLYCEKKYWIMNKEFNIEYFNSLIEERKKTLTVFADMLERYKTYDSFDELLKQFKETGLCDKKFYQDFYNMVFGSDKGIPLKKILENYDLNQITKLLCKRKNNVLPKLNSRLIHLSDLHFDIEDDEDILESKWQQMINYLKVEEFDNYLIVSGDMICYYNMEDNFEMCYRYLSYLTDELQISYDKILVCTGNHEMIAYDNFKNSYFASYDELIKNRIIHYNNFLKRLCNLTLSSSQELYYLRQFEKFDILVVNLLFSMVNEKKTFHQNKELINELLANYKKARNKFGLILSHAPYNYNPKLFDETQIPNVLKYNLCGHKHDVSISKNDNGIIDLVSGNSEGLIDSLNNYNVYEINDNKMIVKKLIYDKQWTTLPLTVFDRN